MTTATGGWPPIGANLARLRRAAHLTQERLAEHAGVSVDLIKRLEQGNRSSARIASLHAIAEALGVPLSALLAERGTPTGVVAALSEEWRRPGARGDPLRSAMQSFRAADRQVGGGHLYATVVKYLHAEVAPRLFGAGHNGGQPVFTAAAALTEMAGWMAHDAGQDQAAEQHFARSLDLVKAGGDRQLEVHILASMSHLAHHLGRPQDAIRVAQQGRDALAGGPRQPELDARLLAMQARGLAARGRTAESTKLLEQAERALTAVPGEERSVWVSRFDEGSLASEAARCLRQLGDLSEAQRQAERVIQLRPGDRTRSRAFGQLILASVLIAQGKPDEACAIARDVVDATRQLGSYLVIQQLADLKQLLAPCQGNRAVGDFLGYLEAAWRERAWLYQWMANDARGHAAGFGEAW